MVFKRSDIYTGSGTVMLQNFWTPYVSKYDTSSFYNWEQDNLPLYDLEERDFELWEQAGYPTSSVPGLSLTVSAEADIDSAVFAANSTVFRNLSSCIAAIPKVVRFPVFVEVCNFGDLGDLELHNFRIEEGGSIEIINRGYAKVYTASGDITAIDSTPEYNKSHALAVDITSEDLSSTLFSPLTSNLCTSALTLSTRVLSGISDLRVSAVNSFLYPKLSLAQAPLSVSLGMNNAFFTAVSNKFKLTPYEDVDNTSVDNTLYGLDISATNQATGDFIEGSQIAVGTDRIGGSVYTNTLDKLSIKNCNGPVFVRNFFVNGESAVDSGREVGIEVTNSDVVLENCAAVRCRDAGFKFNNSKVVLSRSAFSYRNYELSSTTARVPDRGVGFHAVNSDVSISALVSGTVAQEALNPFAADFQASGDDVILAASRNTVGVKLDNSNLHGGFGRLFPTSEDTGGIITCELNTNYGLELNKSNVDLKGLVDIYGNDIGIKAEGSNMTYENLCSNYHSNDGLRGDNSTFIFDSDTNPTNAGQSARHQVQFLKNGQHLNLQDESSFMFARKDNVPISYGNMQFSGCHGVIKYDDTNGANLPAISVDNNSVVNLIHPDIRSRVTADTVESVPSYGLGVKVTNNSVATLFGTGSGCNFVWGPAGYTYQQYTAGLYADNGSEINLHGPTVVAQFGVDVLAENNSTINIQPPRVRDAYGLECSAFDLLDGKHHSAVELHSTRACLVANKNSSINLTDLGAYSPNWLRGGDTAGTAMMAAGVDYPIGTGGFDNSALVSSGSLQFFPNPQDSNAITNYYLADLENANGVNLTIPTFPTFTDNGTLLQFIIQGGLATPNYSDRENATLGGVCLRATQDSTVNVLNVHFPFGTNNSPLDGHYYTVSGTDCDQLMIWNMADTSRLNAAFCSVSGLYPGSAQYHGPSGLWMSSADATNGPSHAYNAPAYGAPTHTPDTGSLSVLDAYGAGSSVWFIPSGVSMNSPFDNFYAMSGADLFGSLINDTMVSALYGAGINVSGTTPYRYGSDTHTSDNQGVFRVYWSPKTSARYLQTDLSGYKKGAWPHGGDFSGCIGPAYQIFAQGYNLSAPLSGLVTDDTDAASNTSAIAPDLLKLSTPNESPTQLWTSGFYYCSEMLEENPTQCILDESASLTFANSRNASVGMSGRPKKVTIIRSRGTASRGSEAYTGDPSGSLGFKSSTIFDLKRDN